MTNGNRGEHLQCNRVVCKCDPEVSDVMYWNWKSKSSLTYQQMSCTH